MGLLRFSSHPHSDSRDSKLPFEGLKFLGRETVSTQWMASENP